VIAGCAMTTKRDTVTTSGFGGQANGEIGLATRALSALNAGDATAAIGFAERAVAKTPDDAGFRSMLGHAYFGAGRFASAEAAYKDALTLYSNQPQTVLKLALAQIAQGKHSEALAFLEAGRTVLDPANYGLAVALAGRPAEAVSVLDAAARVPGADGRIRQNLALAYALMGDWAQARLIAAQDVPAGELDARLQQWMQLAKPARTFDQVASLTGVKPNPADPGQPVRLALAKTATAVAQAAPVPHPVPQAPVAAPEPQLAYAAPEPVAYPSADPQPQPYYAEAAPPPPPLPPENANRVPASSITVKLPPARDIREVAPPPARVVRAVAAAKPAKLRRAAAPVQRAAASPAALRRGNASAVVQLGAYGSPQRVLAAWNAAARRHHALRSYAPISARFTGPRGTVYRLAVKGFGSASEASALCASLRRSGANCFVRNVAGDAPVQLAAR
jgi:Flp pilus assembly protein TadD